MSPIEDKSAVWNVHSIQVGEFGPCPDAYVYRGGKTDFGYNIPSIIYLLQNRNKNILVDTSFSNPEDVREKMEIYCSRSLPIDLSLNNYGVSVEQIKTVILTHLHWDHAGSIDLFPNASFICQCDEYKWLLQFHEWEIGYPRWFSDTIPKNRDRFELIKGDVVVDDGIEVWWCGGHTPGSQMIAVKTENGLCVITGDNAMVYENVANNIPVGLFCNLHDCISSIERIKKNADFFIPSHDWRVFDKTKVCPGGRLHE